MSRAPSRYLNNKPTQEKKISFKPVARPGRRSAAASSSQSSDVSSEVSQPTESSVNELSQFTNEAPSQIETNFEEQIPKPTSPETVTNFTPPVQEEEFALPSTPKTTNASASKATEDDDDELLPEDEEETTENNSTNQNAKLDSKEPDEEIIQQAVEEEVLDQGEVDLYNKPTEEQEQEVEVREDAIEEIVEELAGVDEQQLQQSLDNVDTENGENRSETAEAVEVTEEVTSSSPKEKQKRGRKKTGKKGRQDIRKVQNPGARVTIRDFIRDNSVGKPMRAAEKRNADEYAEDNPEDVLGGPKRRRIEEEEIVITDMGEEELVRPNPAAFVNPFPVFNTRNEEDENNETSTQQEDGFEENLTTESSGFVGAPQLRFVNGELVLDEGSIAPLDRHNIDYENEYERVTETHGTKYINQNTFARYPRTQKWTKDETLLFYKGLRMFGSDFSLISRLFPKRIRREVKNKFKKEERENRKKVEFCLKNRIPIDMDLFQRLSADKEKEQQAKEGESQASRERREQEERVAKEFEESMRQLQEQEGPVDETEATKPSEAAGGSGGDDEWEETPLEPVEETAEGEGGLPKISAIVDESEDRGEFNVEQPVTIEGLDGFAVGYSMYD